MSSWFKRSSSAEPANAAAANGKPLLLIGFNEATQKWEVGQEALAALKAIPGPLCTISVCGRARQGKSFLLNAIIEDLRGEFGAEFAQRVAVTAATGIAATHIQGSTLNSALGCGERVAGPQSELWWQLGGSGMDFYPSKAPACPADKNEYPGLQPALFAQARHAR